MNLFRRLAGRMRFRGAIELPGAVLEGGDHAAHGFVEQHLDNPLQYARAELEIDKEIDPAAARYPFEDPVIAQIFERALGIGDIDPVRRAQTHARCETLAKHAEPDNQI